MFNVLKRLLVQAPPDVPPAQTLDLDLSRVLQKTDDSRSLSEGAKRWLVSIPEDMWPKLICVRNPTVVNQLADLWNESVRLDEYIDDLTKEHEPVDMPLTYREELARLKAFRKEWRRNADAVGVERRARGRAH